MKLVNIINDTGEQVQVKDSIKMPERRNCTKCGFVSSQEICKACVLLEGLNRGLPKLGIGKCSKAKKIMSLDANIAEKRNRLQNIDF